jgi:mRNA-degrading endonuclease RelE of RelBE toxin-antitoxin system
MRRVVRSRTYVAQLKTFIEQGTETFGAAVAERTLARIDHTIEQHLARYPKKPIDDRLGLYVYAVSRTPFVLIYDFDDEELRIHFIVPGRADRTKIDPMSVHW